MAEAGLTSSRIFSPMPEIKVFPQEGLNTYQNRTFRYASHLRLISKKQAIEFVNERGFIFFWPIKGFNLPSLWGAVAGDRPVPNTHDDPAHITWRWKDDLLGKKKWYYAKILRNRSTIISLELLPYFYAISPNYGEPEQDYLINYHDGNLSSEEKSIFEALLSEGPLDSISLRRIAGLASPENTSRFNRALSLLQRDFRILPIGVTEAGAWKYAFSYDVFHRQFPHVIVKAHTISRTDALKKIMRYYFLSVGSSRASKFTRLFNTTFQQFGPVLREFLDDRFIVFPTTIENQQGEWFTIKQLLS